MNEYQYFITRDQWSVFSGLWDVVLYLFARRSAHNQSNLLLDGIEELVADVTRAQCAHNHGKEEN